MYTCVCIYRHIHIYIYSCRTFEQTFSFIEKVATTRTQDDLATLIKEIGMMIDNL
jgi:hypothetical protein